MQDVMLLFYPTFNIMRLFREKSLSIKIVKDSLLSKVFRSLKKATALVIPQKNKCAVDDNLRFSVGTLAYSRAGLVTLFSWLLGGAFILNVMENVMPSLLPLVLRDNGASNKAVGFIVSSLYMLANAIASPVIGYKSDRFRSRWGRRRPFILFTTPFVVVLLALIPFAPAITRALGGVGLLDSFFKNSPVTILVAVSAILVAAFQVFNMFVSSVYYYLVVDVVPEAFIARFYGLFQIFAYSGLFVFQYFIFGMAKTHMHEIFVGIALLYGIFITLVCLKVKEGEYPPLKKEDKSDCWWSGIRTYAGECFGHTIYWGVFFVYGVYIWSNVSNVFLVFLFRDQMGLTLDQIGKVNAYVGVFSMIIIYPLGILIDRLGSHKSLIAGMICYCVIRLASFFFIHGYWSLLMWHFLWMIPFSLLNLSLLKWTVDLYPRKLYGQFGSAGAMVSSGGAILLGPICGYFFDLIHDYRYALLWPLGFQMVGILVALMVYRKWKALGGEEGYQSQCDTVL
jgi:maltose/moltooligosaccharide transporter